MSPVPAARTLPACASEAAPTRRPRLLISAARHGMEEYRSDRDLPRLIGTGVRSDAVIGVLAGLEERLELARRSGDPTWSCLRHVEVMIALLAEKSLRHE
ncbi:hypothetical protein C0V75_07315 [Tabrizicola sp. TH137]|uniref:DUF6477 family protein n=1 Tax=Tabrizicola sp. TH137 TaxID=2067452 RepID=UPI000C7D0148|nr:DUF6477 family protein [Tabrizicola sp. TH137]PLL13208.1 hypothetical protein C0V75_07315 [Tabrizicola sp. TH137]